jgi:sporulation protein YlmC with PRC-barrel domain
MHRVVVFAVSLATAIAPAVAQPPVPAVETTLVPPTPEVSNYELIDYNTQSIDLARLQGVSVYSSQTMGRIGHVDDVYIDSATGKTYLGLEIGGLFEIGDKEIVITLDETSIYRRVPFPADPYAPGAVGAPNAEEAAQMREMQEKREEYLEKFGYRYANYRIYIDATEETLADYPEFDLY